MRFRDRADAGHRLAAKLEPYRFEHPIILALPRGGVPVAFEVARALGARLDVLMVRRIGAPGSPDCAVGVAAEGGGVYLNPAALREVGLSDSDAAALAERQSPELASRIRAYRAERPPPKLAGRTVILVDDGVATGATVRAAARAARKRGAAKVILAAPVIARPTELALREEVDAIVAVELTLEPASIGDRYERFEEISDAEVVACLRRAPAARAPAAEGSDLWDGEWIGGEFRDPPPRADEVPYASPSPRTASARHTFEDHIGELALRIEAPTLPMLFEEAGRALSEAMGRGDTRSSPADHEEKVTVAAPDREALLVEWLNELVYRAEVSRVLPREFKIERLSERDLDAVVRGIRLERLRNPVKAATFHGLSIAESPEGFRATIVLDV
jgi:putative phosphoribosyl transferase